jgi:Skp family chaperone for outer membrane proteins
LKKLIVLSIGIALVALVGCNDQSSQSSVKIGVVDVIKVAKQSSEGQKALSELQALVKSKQDEIKQKTDSIKDLQDKLAKAPAESKQPLEEELKKATDEYHKLAMSAEAEVKNRENELHPKLMEGVKKVINDIGNDEKFTVILTADNALYFQKPVDITDKVLQKYNESTKGK